MTRESDFIAAVRSLASHPGARGLLDDAAVLEFGGRSLVLTHDMIVEGVHFLPSDPPEDIGWKLAAVNLSDLAGKGARPIGLLLGYTLAADREWDDAFLRGLGHASEAFGAPLLGGDTVAAPAGTPRSFGLTAIGEASAAVPGRSGARAGDALWVTGTIGDAGAGLCIARDGRGPETLLRRYRRPEPRLDLGRALAPLIHAMMDVSDGLLIDAARMAEASGLGVVVELSEIPLSQALVEFAGDTQAARLEAASAGDDYELLLAVPAASAAPIATLAKDAPLTRIGRFEAGRGLRLLWRGEPIPLPPRLGYQHGS